MSQCSVWNKCSGHCGQDVSLYVACLLVSDFKHLLSCQHKCSPVLALSCQVQTENRNLWSTPGGCSLLWRDQQPPEAVDGDYWASLPEAQPASLGSFPSCLTRPHCLPEWAWSVLITPTSSPLASGSLICGICTDWKNGLCQTRSFIHLVILSVLHDFPPPYCWLTEQALA